MRVQIFFMPILALPASAAAHSGPHGGIDMINGIAHLLEQYYTQGLAGVLMTVSLLAGYLGMRCITDQSLESDIHFGVLEE